MNYNDAIQYLQEVNKLGSVLGLDSIRRLLSKLGNPQDELKVIHVAGTNGKGSTISFLQSILMEAGYSVGRYSSPAVFEYREIIRINNQYIGEESVAEIITLIKEQCDLIIEQGLPHPTTFEIETAMALMYFKKMGCDVAIVECGMGGETDATNVFDNVLCSIITPVSLDHMQFLGETVEEIARVKAGIIKTECPVIIAPQSEAAIGAISCEAEKKNVKQRIAKRPQKFRIKEGITCFEYIAADGKRYDIELKLMGSHQMVNAATAIEAATVLAEQGYEVDGHIEDGIKKTTWPGRLEVISNSPFVVIDGAHNPEAVEELRASIDLYFTNKRITFIMGVLADKDFSREAEIIADRAENIITVTPNNPRALDGRQLAITLGRYNNNVQSADSVKEAVRIAKETINKDIADMILAFGSLSYLSELKSVINE